MGKRERNRTAMGNTKNDRKRDIENKKKRGKESRKGNYNKS
jgi:hypothetical protein